MDHERFDRLSRIDTIWTVVGQAHHGTAKSSNLAQQAMLQRYSDAIYRYLLGSLRDSDAASDVFQQFALRFVRGDFKRADPEKGRFRDFVKTSLFHLIVDHQKARKGQIIGLNSQAPEPVARGAGPTDDQEFAERWREELLAKAWEALETAEKSSGQPFFTVLRYRADNPDASSDAMAEAVGGQLNRPLSAPTARQMLHRAREKFADLLLAEVGRSIESNDADDLEQELLDLGLHSYCKTALERLGKK